MESQLQQPEFSNTTSEDATVSKSMSLTRQQPVVSSDQKWQRLGAQVSNSLAKLPEYVQRIFTNYRQLLVSIALLLAAIVLFKVVLAVMDTLNDIPLLIQTLELIGIGYTVWFTNRYLLTVSNRQELLRKLQSLKQYLVGS